jgi:hypothetical protein
LYSKSSEYGALCKGTEPRPMRMTPRCKASFHLPGKALRQDMEKLEVFRSTKGVTISVKGKKYSLALKAAQECFHSSVFRSENYGQLLSFII